MGRQLGQSSAREVREEVKRGQSRHTALNSVAVSGDDAARGRRGLAALALAFSASPPGTLSSYCKPLLLRDNLNEFFHNPQF